MVEQRPVLYLLAGGARPTEQLAGFVAELQADGWQVAAVLTPSATAFVDVTELAELTGFPVRSTFKHPSEPDVLPPAAAMAATPATFNMVNKWAAGISDTLALGLLNEAIGLELPLLAAPWAGPALAAHPAFTAALDRLRGCGVGLVWDEPRPEHFPWARVRARLAATLHTLRSG